MEKNLVVKFRKVDGSMRVCDAVAAGGLDALESKSESEQLSEISDQLFCLSFVQDGESAPFEDF